MQGSQADKSKHTQLLSVGQATASPIVEEDEGVETSTPPPYMEITSPNQPLAAPSDNLNQKMHAGDNDLELEGTEDQFIMASRVDNVVASPMPTHGPSPSIDVMPVADSVVISQEDLDQLEKVNPLNTFDFLANDILFSRSTGRSSNVSAEDPSPTSKDNLLAEFQSKVPRADLFDAIGQDEGTILDVKYFLCKLRNLPSGSKFETFSKALEPLLENIKQGFHQKKAGQAKLKEQTARCDKLLDEVIAFKAKLEAFRQETPTIQHQVVDIDSSIAKYKAEIERLENQKIHLLAKEDLMKQEAQIAIQKVKES